MFKGITFATVLLAAGMGLAQAGGPEQDEMPIEQKLKLIDVFLATAEDDQCVVSEYIDQRNKGVGAGEAKNAALDTCIVEGKGVWAYVDHSARAYGDAQRTPERQALLRKTLRDFASDTIRRAQSLCDLKDKAACLKRLAVE